MNKLHATALALLVLTAACGPELEPPDELFESIEQGLTYCPGPQTLEGIDVSSWQGTIDWDKVKAAGKVFAIARVSHGSALDRDFARNWSEMKRVGLVRGVYQYFDPSMDGARQADVLLGKIGTLAPGDLAPVIDVEDTGGGLGPAAIRAAVAAWVNRIKTVTGRTPIIYTGKYFWDDHVQTNEFADLPLWLANYSARCPILPSPWTKWRMHQYSSTGRVSGITGNVDLNVFDGTRGDLAELAGLPRCTATCDGTTLVRDDCARVPCGSGEACVADSFGARCVNQACPATGEATACATSTRLGRCVNGKLAAETTACPDAEYCSTAVDGQARCISAFCVPDASSKPVAHTACDLDPAKVVHCDENGAITYETCPEGKQCKNDGEARCDDPVCPVDGRELLTCVDSNTLGHCAGGMIVDTADCVALGGLCTAASGTPHCASNACVDSPAATPKAHDTCLPDGRLGRCDAQGLLVELQGCAVDTVCSDEDGTADCVDPASIGGGGDTGCGCGTAGWGVLALAGLAVRRRYGKNTRATS